MSNENNGLDEQASVQMKSENNETDAGPRRPCIGLMGEFSAGKTTLINFLLGEDVLPTRVTATQMPPVWISHGKPRACYIDMEGDEHPVELEDLGDIPVEGVRHVKLFAECDLLEKVDLIDTPGISDPNIPDHHRAIIAEQVDAVIWCTHAPQAWRESERSVWATLPEQVQANSILLATRSDKLGEKDRGRVLMRLNREAGEMFKTAIMFSAIDALRSCEEEDGSELWDSSGAAELMDTLLEIAGALPSKSAQVIPISGDMKEAGAASDDGGADEAAESSADADGAPTPIRPVASSGIRPARVSRSREGGRSRISNGDASSMRNQFLDNDEAKPSADPMRAAMVDGAVADEAKAESGDVLDLTDFEVPTDDFEYTKPDSENAEAVEPSEAGELAESAPVAEEAESEDRTEQDFEEAASEVPLEDTLQEDATTEEEPADVALVAAVPSDDETAGEEPLAESPTEDEPAPEEGMVAVVAQTDPEPEEAEEDISDLLNRVAGESHNPAEPEAKPEPAVATSARDIWRETLAANPVETVPELLVAVEKFIDAMDTRGAFFNAAAKPAETKEEGGDISGWRLLG